MPFSKGISILAVVVATVMLLPIHAEAQAPAQPVDAAQAAPEAAPQAPSQPAGDVAQPTNAAAPAEATPAPPEPKKSVPAPAYYVSPTGNDAWSGTLAEPNADKSDGPFATLEAARDALRALRETTTIEGSTKILVRGGVYRLAQPFVLEPRDSGRANEEVVYGAYPGERPVLSGGKVLAGWKQDGSLWKLDVPDIAASEWRFNSIWIDGARRCVARTPNEGFFRTAGKAPPSEIPSTGEKIVRVANAFKFKPGDIVRWNNLDDALVVALHAWETSFHRISSIDDESHVVTFRNASLWPFEEWGPGQRYYVLNTLEGLDAPGEWYADRPSGVISYMPEPGEDLSKAEVVAPFLTYLVSLEGNPASNQYVQYVRIDGLEFQHASFPIGMDGHADPQGAVGVSAAVHLIGAQFCTVANCSIDRADTYGIWVRAGSFANALTHNELYDLGAGGIRLGEQQRAGENLDVLHNIVENNFIHDLGHVFRSGVGIWVGQSPLNTIAHNDVSNLSNSAITVGWAWTADQGFSNNNLIEFNCLHHLGKGEFSNMAGVYVLGGSWNSVVRNNAVHDVYAYLYGGWGIHADEGSSNLDIENNVVYNTTSAGYDQNYGNLNRVQNNIFAFSGDAMVCLTKAQDLQPVLFERNILATNNGLPFGVNWDFGNIWHDGNCYWDTAGWEMDFCGDTFKEWQGHGKDVHSIVADPLFEDVKAFDFRLKADSPALALGFHPIDMSAGLRGDAAWVAGPGKLDQAAVAMSEALEVRPVHEDFEALAVKDLPPNAYLFGTDSTAKIQVTDETAASGQKSLKVTDSSTAQQEWQPEMCFAPQFKEGHAVCSFDLRLEPGAIFQTDWRSDWTGRRVGPRVKFNDKGEVSVGNDEKPLMTVPLSEWVHVEIACDLGKAAAVPATYSLAVTAPGKDTQRFDGLECMYKRFRSVERCWFMSPAKAEAAYYLDNIAIEVK